MAVVVIRPMAHSMPVQVEGIRSADDVDIVLAVPIVRVYHQLDGLVRLYIGKGFVNGLVIRDRAVDRRYTGLELLAAFAGAVHNVVRVRHHDNILGQLFYTSVDDCARLVSCVLVIFRKSIARLQQIEHRAVLGRALYADAVSIASTVGKCAGCQLVFQLCIAAHNQAAVQQGIALQIQHAAFRVNCIALIAPGAVFWYVRNRDGHILQRQRRVFSIHRHINRLSRVDRPGVI